MQSARPPLSVLLLCMGAFFCPWTDWLAVHGVISWSDVFVFSSALVFLAVRFARNEPVPISLLMLVTALLLVVVSLFSWFAFNNQKSFAECLKLVTAIAIVPTVVAWSLSVSGMRGIRLVLAAWMLGAAASAAVAVGGRYGITMFGLHDPGAGGRAWGLTYHPNSLAYCSAMTASVALFLLMTTRVQLLRAAYLAVLALLLYSIQLSGSRIGAAALLASGVPFIIHLLTHSNQRRIRFALGVGAASTVALAVAIILGAVPLDDPESAIGRILYSSHSTEHSDWTRDRIHERAWSEFENSPVIGAGFHRIRVAHNYPRQILHAGGFLAMSVFCVWALGLGYLYVAHRREQYVLSKDPDQQLLWVLLGALLVCWAVIGLKQTTITDRNGYFWLALLLNYGMTAQQRVIQRRAGMRHARSAALRGAARRPRRIASRAV